jgi:HSP20 family protein
MRDPWTTFESLHREMNGLLDSFDGAWRRRTHAFPALNVWEDASHLYAEAEVPGLDMKDLEMYVEGDELTVKGRRPTFNEKDWTYHRRERGTGEFCRTVRLPVQVEADKVEATLSDGVLKIVLPKAEAAKARRIKVTAG